MPKDTKPHPQIKTDIHKIYKAVHDSKDNGVDIKTTLNKYGITQRMFYHKCKIAGLKPWRVKNKNTLYSTKPIRPQIHEEDLDQQQPKHSRSKDKPPIPARHTKKDKYDYVSSEDEPLTVIPHKQNGGLQGGNMSDPKKHSHKREAANPSTLTNLEERISKLNND